MSFNSEYVTFISKKTVGDMCSVSNAIALLPITFVLLKSRNDNMFEARNGLPRPLINFRQGFGQ